MKPVLPQEPAFLGSMVVQPILLDEIK